MTDLMILDTLKDFLKEKVTSGMKLQKANDKDITVYELVNPEVHVGWVPPKGYLPEGMESSIPCIIVGHDQGDDDGQEAGLNIRLSFAVFSPGQHKNDSFTPDFEGYRDLMNFIEKAKQELIKNRIIGNSIIVEHPFKWGMYQEQPYPYWYGWLTFRVQKTPGQYVPDIATQYL